MSQNAGGLGRWRLSKRDLLCQPPAKTVFKPTQVKPKESLGLHRSHCPRCPSERNTAQQPNITVTRLFLFMSLKGQ